MNRYEFEQDALQSILNKTPDDFTQDFTDGEMRESLNEFLTIWATYRHDPVVMAAGISNHIARMISYQAKYSKRVDDTLTSSDLWNYNQDMKTEQWERRNEN
jgi:hypothetical protein